MHFLKRFKNLILIKWTDGEKTEHEWKRMGEWIKATCSMQMLFSLQRTGRNRRSDNSNDDSNSSSSEHQKKPNAFVMNSAQNIYELFMLLMKLHLTYMGNRVWHNVIDFTYPSHVVRESDFVCAERSRASAKAKQQRLEDECLLSVC